MVSGMVALMMDVNPSLTPAEIECIIKMTASRNVFNAPEGNFAKTFDVEAAVIGAQNWPNLDKGEELVLSEDEFIFENLDVSGDIRITTGTNVLISSKISMLHPKANIIVENGARLTLSGAVVDATSCSSEWRGFIVEGNSNKEQPDPFGAIAEDDAGVLLLIDNDINNARNAVSTFAHYRGSESLSYSEGPLTAGLLSSV